MRAGAHSSMSLTPSPKVHTAGSLPSCQPSASWGGPGDTKPVLQAAPMSSRGASKTMFPFILSQLPDEQA